MVNMRLKWLLETYMSKLEVQDRNNLRLKLGLPEAQRGQFEAQRGQLEAQRGQLEAQRGLSSLKTHNFRAI